MLLKGLLNAEKAARGSGLSVGERRPLCFWRGDQ